MVAIAAVTVAVLAIGAAVFLLPSRTSAEPFRSYSNTGGVIPYTLSRPQSWAPREGNASDAVLSPRPDAVGDTFLFGSADRWSGTRQLLAASPSDAVGMYVFPTDTGSDTTTDALKGAISVLMPDGITWASTHRQLTVGGSPADELEGVVQDPTDPKARLRVLFDVVQPPTGGSVLIAFFAPPDRFDAEQATFARIRDGIKLT